MKKNPNNNARYLVCCLKYFDLDIHLFYPILYPIIILYIYSIELTRLNLKRWFLDYTVKKMNSLQQKNRLIQRFYHLVIFSFNISITLWICIRYVIWLVHPGTTRPRNHCTAHLMTCAWVFGAPGSRCKVVVRLVHNRINSTAIKLVYKHIGILLNKTLASNKRKTQLIMWSVNICITYSLFFKQISK